MTIIVVAANVPLFNGGIGRSVPADRHGAVCKIHNGERNVRAKIRDPSDRILAQNRTNWLSTPSDRWILFSILFSISFLFCEAQRVRFTHDHIGKEKVLNTTVKVNKLLKNISFILPVLQFRTGSRDFVPPIQERKVSHFVAW